MISKILTLNQIAIYSVASYLVFTFKMLWLYIEPTFCTSYFESPSYFEFALSSQKPSHNFFRLVSSSGVNSFPFSK